MNNRICWINFTPKIKTMIMKNIIKTLSIAFVIFIGYVSLANAQSVTLPVVNANAGDNVIIPLNVSGLTNVGSITLYIEFDDDVLTYNGFLNLWSGASSSQISTITQNNITYLVVSWFDFSGAGVNFPNGKYFDIDFTFNGGGSNLTFAAFCEITDSGFNPILPTYNNGSISEASLTFDLTVYLEGAYDPDINQMKTDLLNAGNIPLTQPFEPSLPYYGNPSPVWYYSGTESVITIPANVVDWVLLELRDASTASQATTASIVGQKPCFILDDGSIVDLDGSSLPQFFVTINDGAFIVVYHRNHLGIMSASALSESGGIYTEDFRNDPKKVAGQQNGYKLLETGVYGMVAGDANGDKQIDIANDKNTAWSADAGNSGYYGGDLNMNVETNNNDKNEYLIDNTTFISGIPN
jgi:hypothetical protein